MKILMVSQMVPYLPCHDGFRLIPANLLRLLAARHEFHLLALSNGTEDEDQRRWTQSYCRSSEILRNGSSRGPIGRLARLARSLPPETEEAVRTEIQRLRPDVLHLEGPAVAPLAPLAPSGVTSLLSAHDALSLRYQEFSRFARSSWDRAVYALRALAARRFERRWYQKVDRVVVTSFSDSKALSQSVPRERLAVIPNGVDLDYWAYRPQPKPGRIVFTGNMSWLPNEDAAEYFALQVFPLIQKKVPEVEFFIVGAEPTAKVRALAKIRAVRVTGTVSDLRDWIWSAQVYVSPLRFGAGVKNKILEAMALGTPIVATPQSLTGTPLENGRHLLIAESAAGMAEAVLILLRDERLRGFLSQVARREVELNYSWESIAARFEDLYCSVIR